MKKNQQGFSVVELLLLLLFIGVIAGIGYVVYNKSKSKTTGSTSQASQTTSSTTTTATAKTLTWTEGGYAVEGTFADADVVKVSDTQWRMYYAIQPEVKGNNFEVYSATSSDGKTWTKDPGTRKTMATFPDVVKLKDGRYRMYYQQAGVIKSAISTDGLAFTEEAGTRLDKTNDEGLVFDNVAAPSVLQTDDGFIAIYRGTINSRYAANTPNPSTQLLMWATSTDGLTFTKKGIAVDSRNSTLNGQLDGPDLVKWDDGKYRVFSTSYTGVYEFTFDGTTFSQPTLALAGEAKQDSMGFHGSPPGDPTTIKINGVWYMYYGGPREQNGIHYATLQ